MREIQSEYSLTRKIMYQAMKKRKNYLSCMKNIQDTVEELDFGLSLL